MDLSLTVAVTLLVGIVGAIIYLLLTSPPGRRAACAQLALVAWGCGLLAFLFGIAGRTVPLIR